jgi:hypothetical protein
MNDPRGFLVDHKNGAGLDNRSENLRKATHSQNTHNSRKIKNTSSQFRGVSFAKKRGLWETQITVERKKIFLGRFKNEIDAALAYDAAAKKYCGEFARLNFPDNVPLPQRHKGTKKLKFSFLFSVCSVLSVAKKLCG